ncbi:MAG: hypothetical protein BroJett011_69320 [Chloroflexota bacterium]|nr:MAG: hypothetical protein BroJett011_69320 [Chloroflexota bacterium]
MYNLLVGHSGLKANDVTGQSEKRVAADTSFRRYYLTEFEVSVIAPFDMPFALLKATQGAKLSRNSS